MVAFAADYLVIAVYLVVLAAIGSVINAAAPQVARALFGNPLRGQLTGLVTLTLPVSLYFALGDASRWRGTWGKRLRGLEVVSRHGDRISIPRSLARTALKFAPWELAHACIWQARSADPAATPWVIAGFLLVYAAVGANVVSVWFSPTNQTLYDRAVDTVVVAR